MREIRVGYRGMISVATPMLKRQWASKWAKFDVICKQSGSLPQLLDGSGPTWIYIKGVGVCDFELCIIFSQKKNSKCYPAQEFKLVFFFLVGAESKLIVYRTRKPLRNSRVQVH
jgi:hypothetical protein